MKLNDLLDQFEIASGIEDFKSANSIVTDIDKKQQEAEREAEEAKKRENMNPVKEIAHFTQSLKRTEKLEKGLDSASQCILKILPSDCPKFLGYDFSAWPELI